MGKWCALLHHDPNVDIVRVQDTEIYQADDPVVLEWAAKHRYILLTHDIDTMVGFANERITAELPMTGVILIRQSLPIGKVVEDLLTVLGASDAEDWVNVVTYLPL